MFSLSDFWNAFQAGFTHILTSAASDATSIHTWEASHPAVADALALADTEVPGFSNLEGIANTLLTAVQSYAKGTAPPTP